MDFEFSDSLGKKTWNSGSSEKFLKFQFKF